MIGTIAWLILLGACVVIELLARRYPTKISTLSLFGATLSSQWVARVILVLFWVFVGVHLFARYTIPRH
jgi:hypothetical protein